VSLFCVINLSDFFYGYPELSVSKIVLSYFENNCYWIAYFHVSICCADNIIFVFGVRVSIEQTFRVVEFKHTRGADRLQSVRLKRKQLANPISFPAQVLDGWNSPPAKAAPSTGIVFFHSWAGHRMCPWWNMRPHLR